MTPLKSLMFLRLLLSVITLYLPAMLPLKRSVRIIRPLLVTKSIIKRPFAFRVTRLPAYDFKKSSGFWGTLFEAPLVLLLRFFVDMFFTCVVGFAGLALSRLGFRKSR